MAFVQAVGSQNPVFAELIVAPRLDDVLVHSQKVASTLPERAQPTFDETVERQPMKRRELEARISGSGSRTSKPTSNALFVNGRITRAPH